MALTLTPEDIAAVAAAVWSYATRTLTASSTAPGTGLTAQTWTIVRGDDLARTFAAIAADATITKAQLTVKRRHEQDDVAATLAVDSETGLLRLNGEDPGALTATLTLAGELSIPAATTQQLAAATYNYDVQVWRTAAIQTLERGTFVVTADITRTVVA